MAALIIAESAIFTIFVVAYLFYIGKSLTRTHSGAGPRNAGLDTICLFSSSITVHLAENRWSGRNGDFLGLWLLTVVLGACSCSGTAQEWHHLIYEHGLTISTNLFGTTYYSLVGLHAFHVTAGLAHAFDRPDL